MDYEFGDMFDKLRNIEELIREVNRREEWIDTTINIYFSLRGSVDKLKFKANYFNNVRIKGKISKEVIQFTTILDYTEKYKEYHINIVKSNNSFADVIYECYVNDIIEGEKHKYKIRKDDLYI